MYKIGTKNIVIDKNGFQKFASQFTTYLCPFIV